MPTNSSSMDGSDPATPDTSIEVQDTSNRRKSGRTRHKPVLLQQDLNVVQSTRGGSAKRKLAEYKEQEDNGGDGSDEDPASDDGDSDPAEEELKEKRRKAPRKAAPKPASKKPKTNNAGATTLPVRPAVNGVKKAPKPKKANAKKGAGLENVGTGLYAEVFGRGKDLDEAAASWIAHWNRNQTEAMCAYVNFVLRCTGCELQVNRHDIEDPDNVVGKLTDLQDEYQAQKPADYPLVSKAKGNASFRPTLIEFIDTFITACHAAGLLYSDLAIIENIEIWVSTMSSSSTRPFRHTATLISLTISNSLCKIAAEVADNIAKISRQKESEQKKKRVNDARIKELDKNIAELDRKLSQEKEMLQGMFDTVFVHRYRDVDPKIRLECVTALGSWILTFPDVFFEGIYLRYLGWVLSDSSAPTRAEVIKQLLKLYKNKNNVARLRTFTDRFRPRLIEMAMQDADLSIRVSTIELLEKVRETELLEPDDIDNIGRLIFDSEPRIRKAVAGFFAENINDLYETTLEDFGGQEGLLETLGEEVEDEYDTPRASWLKIKCMAETLQSYDTEEDIPTPEGRDPDALYSKSDSRLSLAAQNIYDTVPEARDWEALTGHLLYDFSRTGRASNALDATFKQRCSLDENEQVFLLELLDVAVKNSFHELSEGELERRGKKTSKQKSDARKVQESMALRLAQTIPKLLKKFGSNPSTASPILALGSIMNLEIFQEMRENSTVLASLLDDFNKQFLSHGDQEVLIEASNALLHAQEYEDLNEITESKIQELWRDTIQHLRTAVASGFGGDLSELSDTIKRIASLATVVSCVDVFEVEGRPNSKKRASKTPLSRPLDLLVSILKEPSLDQHAGEEAAEILVNSTKAVRGFYMWTTMSLQAQVNEKQRLPELPDFSPFVSALSSIASTWPLLSQVRHIACTCILDVHTLFARFRDTPQADVIIQPVAPELQPLILQTFIALEKQYSRLAHKKLESGPVDGEPESDPDDPLDSDDEEEEDDDDESTAQHRRTRILLAEEALCRFAYSIILAVTCKVLDSRVRQRVQRNRLKLGGAFKETLARMEDTPAKGGVKKPAAKAPSKAVTGNAAKGIMKSAAVVRDEDEQSEEGAGEVEEEGEQDLRERELIEDQIVDADEEPEGGGGNIEAEVDDEIMGD